MWHSIRTALARTWRRLVALGETPQDDPMGPPPFMAAAALREAALLSERTDAIAQRKVA